MGHPPSPKKLLPLHIIEVFAELHHSSGQLLELNSYICILFALLVVTALRSLIGTPNTANDAVTGQWNTARQVTAYE